MPPAEPGAPNDTGEDVLTSVPPQLDAERSIKRWRSGADGWFGICLLCGIVRADLPAEHGCRPDLPPEEMAEVMAEQTGDSIDALFEPRTSAPPVPGVPITRKALDASLDGLVAFLRDSTEGQRNNRLYWTARKIAKHVVEGHLPDPRAALDTLVSVAAEVGLDASEATKTIRSGFRKYGVVV